MSAKTAKLFLLTGLNELECADVENKEMVKDGAMLLLTKDDRRIMGYTVDGEHAFIDLKVRREKGQLVDLERLPNVEHDLARLADMAESPLQVIELNEDVERGATFLFSHGHPKSLRDIVGFSNTSANLSQVLQDVNQVNSQFSHEPANKLDHAQEMDRDSGMFQYKR